MTLISSMGGCGSTAFIQWFGKRLKCNCPLNSEGLPAPGPGSNCKGLKHRPTPPSPDDPYLPNGEHIERAVYIFDSPYQVIPSLFRRKIAVGHAIAMTGDRPGHENSIEAFVAEGVDSFGFRKQFEAWTDPHADCPYPRFCLKFPDIWGHLDPLFEFLEIPNFEKDRFPKLRTRNTSFEDLSPDLKQGIFSIYSDFDQLILQSPQSIILK